MSERINLYGFSLPKMRRLFRSRDEATIGRIRDQMSNDPNRWRPDQIAGVSEIVEQAIMTGIPFAGLGVETSLHAIAANALAADGQDWLPTLACTYHRSAVSDALWKRYRKHAAPEIQALLRGLVEGVPLFGQRIDDEEDAVYAAISVEKLRAFAPGLADFRDQVVYRVEMKREPSGEDLEAAEFVTEFCGWLDQIQEAGLDLWYCTG
jgi:hypothetical protein